MDKEERKEKVIKLIQQLESLVGRTLWVTQRITDRDFDQHGTTGLHFRFTLKHVTWRLSGFRIMLDGTQDEWYEISIDAIETCRIEPDQIEILETLGISVINTKLQRLTEIKVR